MATLSQQIENMKTASQEQTQASQALAQEVSGKMGAIDTKVATSIAAVESTYTEKAAGLTIIATDGYRKAVEHNSGGKVHCRIGSSEMRALRLLISILVHCRIGSSEKEAASRLRIRQVHCRIGSSETQSTAESIEDFVHCRIGSSES